MKLFSNIEVNNLSGKDLLKSVAIVFFPSADRVMNKEMSLVSDARVVWGGKEAVEAIIGLPHPTHCEDVIFGPKYSFAVIDKKALESDKMDRMIRNLATDTVLFEQSACSSPHVVFVETDWDGIVKFGYQLAVEFERLSKRIPKNDFDTGTAIRIINKRAEYALSSNGEVIASNENDWTILIDSDLQLEEPIQSRTIFLKPVESVLDTIPLITRNVQTIGNGILDTEKAEEFAKGVMYRGAARCVPMGQMHIYDSPWDGILLLSRLIRWNNLSLME